MASTPSRARWGPAGVVLLLAGLSLWTAAPAPAAPSFEGHGVDLQRKRAYDLGVADFNGDGRLDLYSTNHMFRDSLLEGDGAGRFEDAFQRAGFAPNPSIPGIEDLSRIPEVDDPGLYMWLRAGDRRPHIRLAAKGLQRVEGLEGATASGRIVVSFPKVEIRRRINAEVEVVRRSRTRTVIRFELGRNARLVLRPNHIDLPFRTRIDTPLPLANVFLGPRAVPAPSREFEISLGDRHGVAWADYDRDGRLDAFVSSGGLSGKSRLVPRLGRNELLLNRDRVLVDATDGSGLRKGDCRGREARSLDFDRDRRLDIFLGCRAGRPRLYRGLGDGTFTEQRRALRGVGNAATANSWVDLDNDGVLELVRAGQFSVSIWSLRRNGKASLRQRIDTPNDDKNVEAIAPGDFDNDGDLDLFMAAPSGNSLLVNRGKGRLAARDPRHWGLPARHGAAAAWVDYDNDTRLDLYVSPDGLFRNVGGGFRKVGALGTAGSPRFARATWFDADGDGRRDLVRLTQRGRGEFPQIRMFGNETARRNHWLELDLIGPRGNRQAVGARVQARIGRRTLTQWVGQNDGSRYGQGHYRLYFGLGRSRRAERVTVFWPDGGRSRLGTVGADRLRVVRR